MSQTYDWPDFLAPEPLMTPLAKAEDAVARLDERLRRNPLADGFNARLAYGEACASCLAEGELVHLEDLVLFDAGAFDGPISPALSRAFHTLQVWRHAQQGPALSLLRADRPGDLTPVSPDHAQSPASSVTAPLAAWRSVLHRSNSLPATLAAALLWDAWLILQPEPTGAWRAPLLAALLLCARQKTQALLLPIDTGRRFTKYRRHPAHGCHTRITGCLEWIETAAIRAGKELDNLLMAERLLRPTLAARRRHSRLADLVTLLLSRPVISAPMAARVLRVSPQAVLQMLAKLGPPVRELSGRSRYRVWGIF